MEAAGQFGKPGSELEGSDESGSTRRSSRREVLDLGLDNASWKGGRGSN